MAQHTQLQSADGHKFTAYVAQPPAEPRAGIVVLQEAFGVNAHIQSAAERFARAGYLAAAPALFDRAEPGVELGYGPDSMRKGMGLVRRVPVEGTLADIETSIAYLRERGAQKVGVVGYCWGGRLAWLSNTRLHPEATVSYYPGGIENFLGEKPHAPAMFHFGLRDAHIPKAVAERVRQTYPEFPVFTYDAGHGFNCDARDSYDEESAKIAGQRTMAHFAEYLASGNRA